MEYSPIESEWTGSLGLGVNYSSGMGKEFVEILSDIWWDEIPLKGVVNQCMGDTSKCVLQVKKSYMACFPLAFAIFDNFLHH